MMSLHNNETVTKTLRKAFLPKHDFFFSGLAGSKTRKRLEFGFSHLFADSYSYPLFLPRSPVLFPCLVPISTVDIVIGIIVIVVVAIHTNPQNRSQALSSSVSLSKCSGPFLYSQTLLKFSLFFSWI